jgi:hypothetical protein
MHNNLKKDGCSSSSSLSNDELEANESGFEEDSELEIPQETTQHQP